MAPYIPHSIFNLARLLYATPETFGPYYVRIYCDSNIKNVEFQNSVDQDGYKPAGASRLKM